MGNPDPDLQLAATMTVQQLFAVAVQQHQTGRLVEAEQHYEQILARQPDHAEALHLLGILARQFGRHGIAVDLIRRSLALKPNSPEAHSNFGIALREIGRVDEAIAAYRQAIALKPGFPEAFGNLGNALKANGQLDEAIAAYRQALVLKPGFPEAQCNLGNALKDMGKLDEAIAAFHQSVMLRRGYPEAHYHLGNALRDKGRLDEAIAAFREAIALKPDHAEAHNNLGTALADKGRLDDAIAAFRHAIALQPDFPGAFYNLANALKVAGRLDEAIAACREAIRLKEDSPDCRFVLAALTGDASARTAPAQYVQSLFDNYASRFDQHLVGKLDYRVPELLLHAILAVAPGRKFDILDLGCGTGLCGMQFRPHARRLVGVDLSPRMLQKAADRNVYDQLVTADALAALQDRPDGCDLILAGDVFIYVGDLSDVFHAAARALRPRGFFAFSIERSDGPDFILHSKCRFAHSLGYVRGLAQQHGLAEIHVEAIVVRKEGEQKIRGWIVVLGKPNAKSKGV